jgi:hypothetical protein
VYKATQDNSDFMGRVGSHATKASRTGVVWDIPAKATEEFQAELDEMNRVIDAAKVNIAAVRHRVRHLRSFQAKLDAHLTVLTQNSSQHGLTYGRRKGILRCMVLINRAAEAILELSETARQLSRQVNTDAMGIPSSRRGISNADAMPSSRRGIQVPMQTHR